MTTVNVRLTDPLDRFVLGQTQTEGFASPDEYVLALIKQAHQAKEYANLETKLLAGVDSLDHGKGKPFDPVFWDNLRRTIQAQNGESEAP